MYYKTVLKCYAFNYSMRRLYIYIQDYSKRILYMYFIFLYNRTLGNEYFIIVIYLNEKIKSLRFEMFYWNYSIFKYFDTKYLK